MNFPSLIKVFRHSNINELLIRRVKIIEMANFSLFHYVFANQYITTAFIPYGLRLHCLLNYPISNVGVLGYIYVI